MSAREENRPPVWLHRAGGTDDHRAGDINGKVTSGPNRAALEGLAMVRSRFPRKSRKRATSLCRPDHLTTYVELRARVGARRCACGGVTP